MFKLMIPTGDKADSAALAAVLRLVADEVETAGNMLPADSWDESWSTFVHDTRESYANASPIIARWSLTNYAGFDWSHYDARMP